jgi:hypothetical protein
MQTMGMVLVVSKRRSPGWMSMLPQDGRSAYRLLYLAAVQSFGISENRAVIL